MYFDFAQCKQQGSAALFVLITVFITIATAVVFYFKTNTSSANTIPKSIITTRQLTPKATDSSVSALTYQNQDLGFRFQYVSKDFTVMDDSEEQFNQRGTGSSSKNVNGDFRKNFKGYVGYEPGEVAGAVVVLGKDQNYDINPFSVWVFKNPDNISPDSWFSKYWYYPFLWGVFDYTSKGHIALDQEATISGIEAKSKVVGYQPGKPEFIYISKDQKMYLLRAIGESGDKILSSFKFN